MFITLEGGEGAGKSTQLRRLALRLEDEGLRVLATREPGGSPRAEALRALILAGAVRMLGPFAETALFAAARADHVARTIRPALADGSIVICDRFTDSTRVYQGVVAGVPLHLVRALERVALDGLVPDLTILLDAPAKLGLARAAQRSALRREAPDRFEAEGLAFHEAVRSAFLAVAAEAPERCRVVDASRGPDLVSADIWALVGERLPPAASRAA